MSTMEIERSKMTDEAQALLKQMEAEFATQLYAAARAVAMARGSKLCEADDVRKAKSQLVSGPLQAIQRIFDMCDRTIKAGSLDGDCPAYDIRYICQSEIQQYMPMPTV